MQPSTRKGIRRILDSVMEKIGIDERFADIDKGLVLWKYDLFIEEVGKDVKVFWKAAEVNNQGIRYIDNPCGTFTATSYVDIVTAAAKAICDIRIMTSVQEAVDSLN